MNKNTSNENIDVMIVGFMTIQWKNHPKVAFGNWRPHQDLNLGPKVSGLC